MGDLPPNDLPGHAPPPGRPPLPVLLQDEHIVAVSMPSGLLVHRDERYPDAPAVLQTVRDQTGRFLYPVHDSTAALRATCCSRLPPYT